MSDQLIPNPQEIYNMYWGEPDRLPCNWMSLDEIADKYNLTIKEIESLLSNFSWERRSNVLQARKIVWIFLTDQWGLEYKFDFEYSVSVGMSNVMFYLHKYGIGINLDSNLGYRETRESHNGSYAVFFVSPENPETLIRALENFFLKYKVAKKRVPELGTENE